jgi:hypothetical protein
MAKGHRSKTVRRIQRKVLRAGRSRRKLKSVRSTRGSVWKRTSRKRRIGGANQDDDTMPTPPSTSGHALMERLQKEMRSVRPSQGSKSSRSGIGWSAAHPVEGELETIKSSLNLQTRVVAQQEKLKKDGWPVKEDNIERPKAIVAKLTHRLAELGYEAVPGMYGLRFLPLKTD